MNALFQLPKRSIDQLENHLISLSEQINAKEYEFLVALREFDLRQGWKEYHFNHCSEWLSMKCGIDVSTGREKVRVAWALFDLPATSEAFADGRLSYSKVRSLTRVATPANELQWAKYAEKATAQQVQARCLQARNADGSVSTADANLAHSKRKFTCVQQADGSVTVSGQLPQETGLLLMKALEKAAAALPAGEDEFTARQADALTELVNSYLSGDSEDSGSTDRYQVVVHVDEIALRAQEGNIDLNASRDASSDLPIETIRRLCCDSAITPIIEDAEGNAVGVGRKHRIVPPKLRKALLARDKHCCYPGCSHDKWLEAHHIRHWADGGRTEQDNLVMLCSKHHRLLHEGGYQIKYNHKGERYIQTSSGRVVT